MNETTLLLFTARVMSRLEHAPRRHRLPIRVLAVAAVVAVAASVAAGSAHAATASRGDPATFVERVVRLVAANRYGDAWELLDPRQQALVPRAAYIACEQLTPIPGRLVKLERRGVRDEVVNVPGTAGATKVKGVTLRLVIAGLARVSLTHTFHAIAVSGAWRWYLPADRFAAYAAGDCPGGGASSPTREGVTAP
jgi:hypothetical protein